MVIDNHCGQKLAFMTSIFPYNSFYMPMFIFISGYFFTRSNTLIERFSKSLKRVLLPYLVWSVSGWLLAKYLCRFGLNWCYSVDAKAIISTLFLGPLTSINGPMWYAVMYFWLIVCYTVLERIFKIGDSVRKEILFQIVFLILGIVTIYGCTKDVLSYNYSYFNYRLFLARLLFYIPFFHFGHIFHNYIEKYIQLKNVFWLGLASLIINLFLVLIYGSANISFVSTSGMGSFKSIWLPYVTSLTGIMFWYSVMKGISDTWGRIGIIDFVADNTFSIMAIHLLFADIPGFFVYFETLKGKFYEGFDINAFIGSAWYRYYDNTYLYYSLICAVVGSILCSFVVSVFIKRLKLFVNTLKTPKRT